MSTSISVEHVSKKFQLGESHHTMIREAFMRKLARLRGHKEEAIERDILWALREVSFQVADGEVVGLIGRNGAGKSTLLKILSKITYPTSGRVKVNGRIGSLLEVGTGFHEELTGRENIYMNGSILGMRKWEIDAAMEQIVEFADIGGFLDTPIKRYSSGMRMRLGFSVAAHLRTDVLFVDEVLAVGDIGFQKKCLGAMRDLGKGGRTIVFVSHNLAAVENLCKRTIWIANGQVNQDGETKDVVTAYMRSYGASDQQTLDLTDVRERRGTGVVRFSRMEMLGRDGQESGTVHSGDALTVRLHYRCERDVPSLHFGVRVFSNLGVLLTEANTWATAQQVDLAVQGDACIDLEIDFLNLMPGTYYIGVWVSSFNEWHDVLDKVCKLEIEPSDYYGTGRGIEPRFGILFLPYRWVGRSPAAGSHATVSVGDAEHNELRGSERPVTLLGS
jgi:lipopolysaccharide transport system ATP-binding protein